MISFTKCKIFILISIFQSVYSPENLLPIANCLGAIAIVPFIIFSVFTLSERSKQKIKEFNVCLSFVKSLLHR